MTDDAPYTNREINTFIKDLRESLQRIEMQLGNNEVALGKVERRLSWWQGVGATVSFILVLIIIPSVAWLFIQVYDIESTLDATINHSINTSLINYGLIKTNH